jgi:chorismate mutase (EC 5.4.99.5)
MLLNEILDKNNLSHQDIVSIIFTSTRDIKSQYPAVAARNIGMTDIPLLCCQEMYVEGSLEKCIRVLMHIQGTAPRKIRHIYLEKAKCLRPDLISKEIHGGSDE